MSQAKPDAPRRFAAGESHLAASDEQAVLAILARLAPCAVDPVDRSHRLVEDLGFDSLAIVRTVTTLESDLDVELPPERLHELRDGTVADVLALVEAARDAGSGEGRDS